MQVEMTVTFEKDEIEAMIQERCQQIRPAVPGSFNVRPKYGYIPPITATFTAAGEEAEPSEIPVLEPIAAKCAQFTAPEMVAALEEAGA